MILKFFLKIILRMAIMVGILLGGGLYLGNLAGGDSNKMLVLLQDYMQKKPLIPALSAEANPEGLPGLGKLGNMSDLLKLAPQGAAGIPEIPVDNAPAQRILKSDEAQNDQLNPRDNPSEWDFIASKTQKCWFHKRTRKKVCEPL
jgi:hypothetical protein